MDVYRLEESPQGLTILLEAAMRANLTTLTKSDPIARMAAYNSEIRRHWLVPRG